MVDAQTFITALCQVMSAHGFVVPLQNQIPRNPILDSFWQGFALANGIDISLYPYPEMIALPPMLGNAVANLVSTNVIWQTQRLADIAQDNARQIRHTRHAFVQKRATAFIYKKLEETLTEKAKRVGRAHGDKLTEHFSPEERHRILQRIDRQVHEKFPSLRSNPVYNISQD